MNNNQLTAEEKDKLIRDAVASPEGQKLLREAFSPSPSPHKTKPYRTAEYKVECTWGDGPDVLLKIKMLKGPHTGRTMLFDLSAEQASLLADELTEAVRQVNELEINYGI